MNRTISSANKWNRWWKIHVDEVWEAEIPRTKVNHAVFFALFLPPPFAHPFVDITTSKWKYFCLAIASFPFLALFRRWIVNVARRRQRWSRTKKGGECEGNSKAFINQHQPNQILWGELFEINLPPDRAKKKQNWQANSFFFQRKAFKKEIMRGRALEVILIALKCSNYAQRTKETDRDTEKKEKKELEKAKFTDEFRSSRNEESLKSYLPNSTRTVLKLKGTRLHDRGSPSNDIKTTACGTVRSRTIESFHVSR